jgi:hypothetical protein
MPDTGPGAMLHNLISACGFKPTKGCGCASFARKLSDNGWLWCLAHQQEIVDWLCAQAKKAGVALSSETVTGAWRRSRNTTRRFLERTTSQMPLSARPAWDV